MNAGSTVRVDRWLCAARIYKSRTLAREACVAGHVRVNGTSVKPSAPVRVGDEIKSHLARGPVVLMVLGLEEKRQSPARARELFEDRSPPAPPPEDRVLRPRRKGRPTKADRRAVDRFRQRHG